MEKMSEKIGVSRQAITKWENGTGTPDIANLMAIADLFPISVDELLSNEKSEKKADYIYESRTEYDIDGKKNYDIKLGGAHTVDMKAYDGEKVVVSLFWIPGTYQYGLKEMGIIYVLNFLLSVIPLDFFQTWVYVKNNRSMLATIIFHLFINIMQEKINMTPETKHVGNLLEE